MIVMLIEDTAASIAFAIIEGKIKILKNKFDRQRLDRLLWDNCVKIYESKDTPPETSKKIDIDHLANLWILNANTLIPLIGEYYDLDNKYKNTIPYYGGVSEHDAIRPGEKLNELKSYMDAIIKNEKDVDSKSLLENIEKEIVYCRNKKRHENIAKNTPKINELETKEGLVKKLLGKIDEIVRFGEDRLNNYIKASKLYFSPDLSKKETEFNDYMKTKKKLDRIKLKHHKPKVDIDFKKLKKQKKGWVGIVRENEKKIMGKKIEPYGLVDLLSYFNKIKNDADFLKESISKHYFGEKTSPRQFFRVIKKFFTKIDDVVIRDLYKNLAGEYNKLKKLPKNVSQTNLNDLKKNYQQIIIDTEYYKNMLYNYIAKKNKEEGIKNYLPKYTPFEQTEFEMKKIPKP